MRNKQHIFKEIYFREIFEVINPYIDILIGKTNVVGFETIMEPPKLNIHQNVEIVKDDYGNEITIKNENIGYDQPELGILPISIFISFNSNIKTVDGEYEIIMFLNVIVYSIYDSWRGLNMPYFEIQYPVFSFLTSKKDSSKRIRCFLTKYDCEKRILGKMVQYKVQIKHESNNTKFMYGKSHITHFFDKELNYTNTLEETQNYIDKWISDNNIELDHYGIIRKEEDLMAFLMKYEV